MFKHKDAWVTTAGYYKGYMKLIGEAFKENLLSLDPNKKVVVLGIASWCAVANYNQLIKVNKKVEYEMATIEKTNGEFNNLDPNHSHFILVDDARHGYGGEIQFRADLEAELAKRYISPIVLLVLGGDLITVVGILEALDRGTPCVFLEVKEDFILISINLIDLIFFFE